MVPNRGKFQTTSGNMRKATTTPKSGAQSPVWLGNQATSTSLAGPEGARASRDHLHFGGAERTASAGGTVWGGHNAHDLVVRFQQPLEAGGGEPWGSKKDNAQGLWGVCHALQRSNNPFKNRAAKDGRRAKARIFKHAADPNRMPPKYTQSARQITWMGAVHSNAKT